MGKGVADYLEMTLFSYALSHLQPKDKVRFYYALKGREGKSGIIKRYAIQYLAKSVLLVPRKFECEVEEFLAFWKCKYQKKRVLTER